MGADKKQKKLLFVCAICGFLRYLRSPLEQQTTPVRTYCSSHTRKHRQSYSRAARI
jgi:hypothetical protein